MDMDSVFTNSMKKLGGGGIFRIFFIPDNIASHQMWYTKFYGERKLYQNHTVLGKKIERKVGMEYQKAYKQG